MKTISLSISLLILCGATFLAAQDEPKLVRRTFSIESRQGNHPNGPDVIGHESVLKGDTLRCMLVEVYDETHKASTACVVRIGSGAKHILPANRSMQSPQDGEATLECLGHAPRRCSVQVN